jgi:hypothetical protein
VVNERLSPVEDVTVNYGGSLKELQDFLSSDDPANPACPSKRKEFNLTQARGNVVNFNRYGPQNTWIAAVNKRGLNPFRHKVGLWLSNYHMAVSLHNTILPLIMQHYDSAMDALEQGRPFHEVLAIGATSAAVAMSYGHQYNKFDNQAGVFSGNDNFAREFHQLFFRINGDLEDADYHENTTIEHTAWALTGMQIDKRPGAYGVTAQYHWWVAPIRFTDHWSWGWNGYRYNVSLHYDGDLEILHHKIVGSTAEEKIFNLARVAIEHQESMENLPVDIINFFADDNLTSKKINTIRRAWRDVVGQENDLLRFLQAYAISTTFHRNDTYKYRTAFSRNMTIYNLNTVDNQESYSNPYPVRKIMKIQGADIFIPVHDVFGGQTSLNASNNHYLFKEAYNNNVNFVDRIAKTNDACMDDSGKTLWVWEKDWARIIPYDKKDGYKVEKVGEWLWNRFISDGQKNYTVLERAYVNGFLATGYHFGYIVDPDNPYISYSEEELNQTRLRTIMNTNANAEIALDSADSATRHEANRRVGMAINFITMTPFMFAMEGK